MAYTINKKPKNVVEISFEIPHADIEVYLEDAATRIATQMKIPGFRPGHAPYSLVEKKIGAMKILEEALEPIVRSYFAKAILAEHLETVGSPKIDVQKLAPGNALQFSATVNLLPTVTKIADYKSISLKENPVTVAEADVDKVLYDLQKMQTRETRDNHPLTGTDRAVIDLVISRDNVPLEGGTTNGHTVLMDEEHYIPGFTKELLGMSEGDERVFTLTFPENHYQKNLAGKPTNFKVVMKEIYRREPPALDNEFAKNVGKETVSEIRDILRKNLENEQVEKEKDRVELELLEKLIAGSQFDDIPDLLINEEVERMRAELERGVASQGMEWNEYLVQIKKSEPDLKLGFVPQALQRVKTALLIRAIANSESIEVSEEEIDTELDRVAEHYKDDIETKNQIYSPDYRDRTALVLRNRKTLERLREITIKK